MRHLLRAGTRSDSVYVKPVPRAMAPRGVHDLIKKFGGCWIVDGGRGMQTNEDVKVYRRPAGTHTDIPIRVYHLMTAALCIMRATTPDFFTKRGFPDVVGVAPTLDWLIEVSLNDRGDWAAVLGHACGNVFCCNPFHVEERTRETRIAESDCHMRLRAAPCMENFHGLRRSCAYIHAAWRNEACWHIPYRYLNNPTPRSLVRDVLRVAVWLFFCCVVCSFFMFCVEEARLALGPGA